MTAFSPDQPISLRAIEITPYDHQGPALLLRDPLGLADGALVVPRGIAPLLTLLDGDLTYAEMREVVAREVGAVSGPALLDQLLEALDRAFLIANQRAARAYEAALGRYRAAPHRAPTLAGISYPDSPAALRRSLDVSSTRPGRWSRATPTSQRS